MTDEARPPTDNDAAAALAPHLDAGETLVWAGRPDMARYCRIDWRLVVTGVFWCGVSGAAFWGFTAAFLSDDFDGLPLGLRAFGLVVAASPFLAVAAYTLGGHVLLRRRRRRRTAFGVTDRRVLAKRPGFGGARLRELPRAGLKATVDEGPVGDVEFHDPRGVAEPVRFDCVRGPDKIADLARSNRG